MQFISRRSKFVLITVVIPFFFLVSFFEVSHMMFLTKQ
jgi:hypothetical protein